MRANPWVLLGIICFAGTGCTEAPYLAAEAPAAIAIVSGDAQSGAPEEALSENLVVVVKDAKGIPVAAGQKVVWTSVSGDGTIGSSSTATTKTNAKGQATLSTFKFAALPGVHVVSATIDDTEVSVSFSLSATVCSADNIARSPFATTTGDGAAAHPYIICSVAQWNRIGVDPTRVTQSYILGQNIDLDGSTITMVGEVGNPFTGTFDGRGFTLSNLTLVGSGAPTGLFARVEGGATVKNLGLTIKSVTAPGQSVVGGVIGQIIIVAAGTTATVSDIQISGANTSSLVSGTSRIGGAIGQASGTSGTIVLSRIYVSDLSVTGSANEVGGVIGYAIAATSTHLSATGGTVTGDENTGGLIGRITGGTVAQSSAITTVVAQSYAGGGLIGMIGGTSTVQDSFARSPVTCSTDGLCGGAFGETMNTTTVARVYAAGAITAPAGAPNLGGLIGAVANTLTLTNSYWDSEVTGQSTSGGTQGTAKTTAQMKTASTYDWVTAISGVWTIADGAYPELKD